MTLTRKTLLTSLAVALPVALILTTAVNRVRERDRRAALARVAEGHLTDAVRDACESNPAWFLAGPRSGRPTAAERALPDAELYLPRPDRSELPFEVFAYDGGFEAGSSAAPRFPDEVRRGLRRLPPPALQGFASGTYESSAGAGVEVGMLTGWSPGPCAVLLFRLRPEAGHRATTLAMFAGFFLAALLVAGAVTALPTWRIGVLARAARASARREYSDMVPVGGQDEIGALGAAFNEAAADIRRRAVDVKDREEALRRHVRQTSEDVAAPLAALEARIAALSSEAGLGDRPRAELTAALVDAHQVVSRLNNLAAVARLRATPGDETREPVNLGRLVETIVASRAPLARANQVDVVVAQPEGLVTWQADPVLVEQAVANVIDNAILYNRPGGYVRVELTGYERDTRFALRITDNGPGVTDEAFAALTANRRFRGDEGRSGRAGRGLGLAVAREVADRFGLELGLSRPSTGGLEVTFSVR